MNWRTQLGSVHDVVMAGLSVVLAFYLRLGIEGIVQHRDLLLLSVPAYMATAFFACRFSGLNKGLWRYASVADLVAILKAATFLSVAAVAVMFLLMRLENFPRSVIAIQWLLLVMLLGGPRLFYRALRDRRVLKSRGYDDTVLYIPVLLVGTGDTAEAFIRSAQKDPVGRYRVVGVIDDRTRRIGNRIHDVPVLGGVADFDKILAHLAAKDTRPQRLIFTTDDMPARLKEFGEQAEKAGLTLCRLPSLHDLAGAGDDQTLTLKPIAIEDVLGRPQAPLDLDAIRGFIAGRRVLVTGAGGSIGAELCRQITGFIPSTLMLLDNGEYNLYEIDREIRAAHPFLNIETMLADVRDGARIERIFTAFRPEIVFHAAALKHVPMVEMHPDEGVLTNLTGTRNVADAAYAAGAAAMVQISTDKAVNPTNVMGATKRLAEYYCQALDLEAAKNNGKTGTHFVTVRFGNVMGSSGSVVPLFKKQLAAGGPLTVTHPDIKRFFMTTREAVGLVLQASAHAMAPDAPRGRIFVLDMGEPVRIVDIARRMIRLAGLVPDQDIKITYTGLRPGEKLFEELFDHAEQTVPTQTPSTMAAIPQPIDRTILRRACDLLASAAKEGNIADILRLLKTNVPGYRPETDHISAQPAGTHAADHIAR